MDDETLIQAAVDYFTEHDKIKLKKIIGEFKQVDTSNTVQELERAIDGDKYYFNEDFDRILDYLIKLHNSDIPRSDLMEFEVSLQKMRSGGLYFR